MTRAHLIATTAMAAVLAVAGEAAALPQSPVVGGGSATFTPSLNSLTVNQSSPRLVVNWVSYNIASGETVTYAQPNNTAIALNIVNSASFTTIDGALNANGGVWIFSPAISAIVSPRYF